MANEAGAFKTQSRDVSSVTIVEVIPSTQAATFSFFSVQFGWNLLLYQLAQSEISADSLNLTFPPSSLLLRK